MAAQLPQDDSISQKSDLSEDDLQNIEQMSIPESTARSTVYGIKKFEQWIEKRGKECDYATVTAEDLNGMLRKYYAEVKPSKPGGMRSLPWT